MTVVLASRNNKQKKNLLQPPGPGQHQSIKRQFLKTKFPIEEDTLKLLSKVNFFFSELQLGQTGWIFMGALKTTLLPVLPTSATLFKNLELQVFLSQL